MVQGDEVTCLKQIVAKLPSYFVLRKKGAKSNSNRMQIIFWVSITLFRYKKYFESPQGVTVI